MIYVCKCGHVSTSGTMPKHRNKNTGAWCQCTMFTSYPSLDAYHASKEYRAMMGKPFVPGYKRRKENA